MDRTAENRAAERSRDKGRPAPERPPVCLHDISVEVSQEFPVWPGDPPVSIERYLSLEEGDPVNASQIASTVHVGTHVDAPLHYFADGAGVEGISLDALIGEAFVVQIPPTQERITREVLENVDPPPGERLLFRTRNSDRWPEANRKEFFEDYVAFSEDAAQWLVARGVRTVGIDYHSVEMYDAKDRPVHRCLLSAGVVILEGLDLSGVMAGRYQLVCLPLKLVGVDGAPARAILLETE